ncbi:MAG: signal recognition particle-docking protein FtsY, partial [Synechococcaceae cyanobacterium RL_1_2]|nr:signal recognition particle-docking protein FtsY [Synechococcaceae cyanobacterium RL_1_2]
MFNWFNRKREQQESNPVAPPPAEEKLDRVDEQTQGPDSSPEDYLEFAKKAFQNIQAKKQVATENAENLEPSELTPAIDPGSDQGQPTSEQQELPEVNSAIGWVDQAVTPDTTTQEAEVSGPAWLQQKSDGLEKLKETAVDLDAPEPEQVDFDDDFLWSTRVLAQQGRSPEEIAEAEIQWLKVLRQGLGKTRRSLVNQLRAVVGQGPLNEEAVMEIESLLLQADVGIEATDYIVETLQNQLKEESLPPDEAIAYLKSILREILDRPLGESKPEDFMPIKDQLNVWLMTGVNGAGKTTTIGKLANMANSSGYKCLIAAADTFRAAAVEQVKVWGERSKTEVVANPGQNTDPAAVVFDAIQAAQSRETELLLVDTAGRLQNKKNLMDELSKIRGIVDKKAPGAHIESLLVIDASLGQNALRQAEVFSKSAKLSGVVLTKLDGTAKGGVAIA